ncbi:putative MFS-type transporter YcaD [Legionella rubrilucens]|uniref:Putative MFS-type transporter YcaD n=1 Tax=Legionella rubrilucens TaxID=458 RepID=A0A0W0XN00_9GAMM|nr:MFS transporter [Legionella rubrilucens]KTD45957.1 putative MFS-type transporter YcaD [Legionella rubrilucens]
MTPLIKCAFAPLFSLFIFLLGAGFFSTLLILKMTLEQASTWLMGAITSVFYIGVVAGSLRTEQIILRLGYRSAYGLFSLILAMCCLLHGFFYEPGLWLVLRFIAGFVMAGVYVVIESWLLSVSSIRNRGQVMAWYMIAFYSAQSVSQFILCLKDTAPFLLYGLAALLSVISVIPIAFLASRIPRLTASSSLPRIALLKASIPGLTGALVSGLIMGVIYGLLPVYLSALSGGVSLVATYMFAVIFGGMLLQYPLGKWSDQRDRRQVLMRITVLTMLTLLCLIGFKGPSVWLFGLMMLFGGLTFALYPISVSDACDALGPEDIVAVTQTLLLAYSVGAMVGPVIASLFMQELGNRGLFIYCIMACAATLPMYAQKRERLPPGEFVRTGRLPLDLKKPD